MGSYLENQIKHNCCGCHACENICPKQCIEMKPDIEGFLYPVIDKNKCINCNLCIKACPITNKLEEKGMRAYACKSKDEINRENSSSGGFFFLLCEYVIKNKGIVFGVAFDDELNVKHTHAETLKECKKFRGSKYVQSYIGKEFQNVKKKLNEGRLVLFSGTPCEIEGLKSFLNNKYENLILVDIACHGVPSPFVYRRYLEYISRKNGSQISNISFRNKSTGWNNYSFVIEFSNGKVMKERGYDNIYIKGFLSDIYLRPSCYECQFKKPMTSADITLADYWGVKEKHESFYDDKGISLILVNTKFGSDILKALSEKLDYVDTDVNYALINNPCIEKSVSYNKKREEFFSLINNTNLEKAITKCINPSFFKRAFRKIKRELVKNG